MILDEINIRHFQLVPPLGLITCRRPRFQVQKTFWHTFCRSAAARLHFRGHDPYGDQTMKGRVGHVGRVALFVAVLLAIALPSATALKVEVDKDAKECFMEHAANEGDTFSGSFMRIYDGNGKQTRGNKWDGAFDLNVRDAKRQIVYTTRHSNEHRFEFDAETAGDHEFCFTNLKKTPVTLFYNAVVGHHYSHDAATTSNLSELEKALQSLRQVSGEVRIEVTYQKQRDAAHRKTTETINRRVFGYSLLEACALVGTAFFQANYVKRLFTQKGKGRGGLMGV